MIDPEALLLATTAFGRRETRLFDEALEWLVSFGSLINVQRLKNLHAGGGLGHPRVLHATAAFVQRHGKLPKWSTLAKAEIGKSLDLPEPFFIIDEKPSTHWGATDPDFLSHGWLRRPPRPQRGLCMPPSPERVANALLTLRALIGVSSRCEIILCLLTRPSARAAELARLTGYSSQSIQSVLGEMVLSGKLRTDGPRHAGRGEKTGRGASKHYYLQLQDWHFMLPAASSPRWLPWAALFAVVQGVDDALSNAAATENNQLLIAIQLRRLLEKYAPDLTEGGIAHLLDYSPDMTGESLLRTLAETLPKVLISL